MAAAPGGPVPVVTAQRPPEDIDATALITNTHTHRHTHTRAFYPVCCHGNRFHLRPGAMGDVTVR